MQVKFPMAHFSIQFQKSESALLHSLTNIALYSDTLVQYASEMRPEWAKFPSSRPTGKGTGNFDDQNGHMPSVPHVLLTPSTSTSTSSNTELPRLLTVTTYWVSKNHNLYVCMYVYIYTIQRLKLKITRLLLF